MAVEKLERDDEVAVLIAPNYGAGWSTWEPDFEEEILFDKDIAQAILANDRKSAAKISAEKYPNVYTGALEDLIVVWIPKGAKFYISEYDGHETLHLLSEMKHFVA